MDQLTSSGSSVTAAAVGKAVGTCAARRPFGGVDNGQFAALMGTLDAVAKFGAPTITISLAWVLSVRGRKGFGQEREGGGEKVSINLVTIGSLG